MDLNHESIMLMFAECAFNNVPRVIPLRGYRLPDLLAATQVFFAVEWGPRMRPLLAPERISRLMARLRASRLSKGDYRPRLARWISAPDPSGLPLRHRSLSQPHSPTLLIWISLLYRLATAPRGIRTSTYRGARRISGIRPCGGIAVLQLPH